MVLLRPILLPIGSPPLARGKAELDGAFAVDIGITPACAGKSIHTGHLRERIKDHPRLRGEKLDCKVGVECEGGSPPLARGKGGDIDDADHKCRITPACAGKRAMEHCGTFRGKDHPRLRGEKILFPKLLVCSSGSPPLARGKEVATFALDDEPGITPACAGKRQKRHI